MNEIQLLQFVEQYGYGIMLVLMIVEGPIITIIAAFLASLGVFHVGIVFALSVIGDMTGDVILYYVGKTWGMRFVRGFGRYMGITEGLVEKMRGYFARHGGKTIFLVKSTTGLCWVTFVTAGIVRMSVRKFIGFSFLGGVVWSSFLVFLGYMYGYAFQSISQYIRWAGWAVLCIAILVFALLSAYKKRQSRKMLEEAM